MDRLTAVTVTARRWCKRGVPLIGALVSLLLLAAITPAGTDIGTAARRTQPTGIFIGYDDAGLAVYRLPVVDVTVDRKRALAELDAEEAR